MTSRWLECARVFRRNRVAARPTLSAHGPSPRVAHRLAGILEVDQAEQTAANKIREAELEIKEKLLREKAATEQELAGQTSQWMKSLGERCFRGWP